MTIRAQLHKDLDVGVDSVDWAYVRSVSPNYLPVLVHSHSYLKSLNDALQRVKLLPPGSTPSLIDAVGRVVTGDTYISEGTSDALNATSIALRAAVSAVVRGERWASAVITRPPGHHCSHLTRINEAQMGFCVLNSAMQVKV